MINEETTPGGGAATPLADVAHASVAPLRAASPQEYYSAEELASILNKSERHCRRILSSTPQDLVRWRPTAGRPEAMYHYSAHPALLRAFNAAIGRPMPEPQKSRTGSIAPDDLAIAMLRAHAVEEYLALRAIGDKEAVAAAMIVGQWQRSPRRETVRWTERLGRYERPRDVVVTVGGFSARTLRDWAARYVSASKDFAALAPERKKQAKAAERRPCGVKPIEIPEAQLNLIYGYACSTARADVVKAIEQARAEYPGTWVECSADTIRRRIRKLDPAGICRTLGKRGVGEFMRDHSPDINRDYSIMSLNEEWQVDDITEDFYGHGSNPLHIIRPYAYAIIRVATREELAILTSETPIIESQTRGLVGFALANRRCGIPDRIRFERGVTTGCSPYLEDLLTSIGVKVSRTSIDGGPVYNGAFPDPGRGRPMGKAVREANNRRHHNMNAFAVGQAGPDERITAPKRLERIKAYAEACAKAGVPSVLPDSAGLRRMQFEAMEKSNATPHHGLPRIALPDGTMRHMTPNEAAQARAGEEISVMPEEYLPPFFESAQVVPVTKNGIRVYGGTYGRFDEELQRFQKVRVYGLPELPGAVYVEELKRCVDLYLAATPDTASDQYAKKVRSTRERRNLHQQVVDAARAAGMNIVLDRMFDTSNPTPGRKVVVATSAALAERAKALAVGRAEHAGRRAERAARFDFSDGPSDRTHSTDSTCRPSSGPSGNPRRGLLAEKDDLAAQLAILKPIAEE